MAEVRLEKVAKAYGRVEVLHDVDVQVRDGEFMTFVGPSGCGKSTLLRMIAGLEDITRGDCLIDGRRVNDEEPAQRGIAMVFQSYALYPHMSLYDNMAFAMRLARSPRQVVDDAVRAAARKLHIDTLLERKPKQLSGGQRQRVAIGRAITRNPKVFLFDEPLSNLDAELRVKMRVEFAKLHRELGATTIYVTHDQVEAMTLSSRIVVLNAGRVAQIGSPLALYHHPANRFVAGFMGSPRMNFIEGRLLAAGPNGAVVELTGGTRVAAAVDAAGAAPGAPVVLGIRPEHLGTGGDHATLPASVMVVEPLGDVSYVHFETEGCPEGLSARLAPSTALQPGDSVRLTLPAAHAHLFDDQGHAFARLTEIEHHGPRH